MTGQQARLIAAASLELEDMVTQLETAGQRYLKDYSEWLTVRRTYHPPKRPVGLRPELAKAVREAVIDSSVLERTR